MATPDYKQIAIDEFEQITSFKLSNYLIHIDSFFTNNYPRIRDWYSGNTNVPDINSFKILDRLVYLSSEISDIVYQNKNRFNKTYFWDLLENLEDVKEQLITTTNLSKLLRSIRTQNSYQNAIQTEYTTQKYDTLEKVQRTKISSNDFDNQWVNLAIRNDLSEDEYDINGGTDLILPSTFTSLFLQSVVDNLVGDAMYGLDFNQKITFVNDDLQVLDYKTTALQSLNILISITKGSVPEFPDLGISEELVVGSTRSAFSAPIIQRQLGNLFNTDDSFLDFQIVSIQQDQDAVFIEFSVNTVRGELMSNTVQIQQ